MTWTLKPHPSEHCTPAEQARLKQLKAENLELARLLTSAKTPEELRLILDGLLQQRRRQR